MWPFPSRSVRLFVQNVPRGTREEQLRRHFEAVTGPGDVLDVSLRTFCATVRMRDEAAGQRARRELHGREFRGHRLSLHRFRGIKIYVGGLPEDCAAGDLLPLFQNFGLVTECDVVKDYGFVHMDNEEDGKTAIENLNGTEFMGSIIVVQRSVKDRKHNENSELETIVEGDTFPDPIVSFDEAMQEAAYQNGPESEDNSYPEASHSRTHSSQSRSYGSKSYDYEDDPDRLSSGYKETSSRHSLYERVRLSPRRSSYDDDYRDKHAVSKRYTTKEADDDYYPSYEYGRHDDFDRRGNGSSKRYTERWESSSRYRERSESSSRYTGRSESVSRYRERSGSSSRYTERSESVSRHRPYERSYLSPPHRSRENHRSYR
ncbi:uncharacterized protein [Anolis sagrei]|uniref:uncharacterized protein n=1 Tax=Anolis sagrei TaxID=38937 RepID=UPI00351FB4F8